MLFEVISVSLIGTAAIAGLAHLFRTPEQKWEHVRQIQGVSADDIHAERMIRENLAILRENVSNYVHVSGVNGWEDYMREDIRIRAEILGCVDPDNAKRFIRIVSGLRHSDILYPDAYDKVYQQPVIPKITSEQQAYWRNIRKAAYTDL